MHIGFRVSRNFLGLTSFRWEVFDIKTCRRCRRLPALPNFFRVLRAAETEQTGSDIFHVVHSRCGASFLYIYSGAYLISELDLVFYYLCIEITPIPQLLAARADEKVTFSKKKKNGGHKNGACNMFAWDYGLKKKKKRRKAFVPLAAPPGVRGGSYYTSLVRLLEAIWNFPPEFAKICASWRN